MKGMSRILSPISLSLRKSGLVGHRSVASLGRRGSFLYVGTNRSEGSRKKRYSGLAVVGTTITPYCETSRLIARGNRIILTTIQGTSPLASVCPIRRLSTKANTENRLH